MSRRGWNWRLDRLYFLAFLKPSRDNRLQPLPPRWPALAAQGGQQQELD
jgi:hypothetical protein